jgi:homoserine dehydrogenase
VTQRVRLCVLGFGGAVRRLLELVDQQEQRLADEFGVEYVVTTVGTGRHGCWRDPSGRAVREVLAMASRPGWSFPEPSTAGPDLVGTGTADLLVEATPLEPGGATAIGHVEAALRAGMDVVTLNKGPIAWDYLRLSGLARELGRQLRFEGTVMDGCPVFSLVERTLPGATVTGFSGVLNSTSNVVLDRLGDGGTTADAVAHAQHEGFAEKDPTHDLSGYDTAVKVAILANVWLGARIDPDQLAGTGVDDSLGDRATVAIAAGRRLRLLGSAARHDEHVDASVDLVEVGPASPFFATADASSTLQIFTDLAGVIEVTERSPGLTQTAYALLADLLHCLR